MKKHYTISPHLIGGTINTIGYLYSELPSISRKTLRKCKPEIQVIHFAPSKSTVILFATGRGEGIQFVVKKRNLLDPCLFDGLADCINKKDFDLQAFVHELMNDQLFKNKIGGRHGSRLIHNETA
jgi:hypothetical protein